MTRYPYHNREYSKVYSNKLILQVRVSVLPNYEYRCKGCGDEFCEVRTFENYNKPKACIKCGGDTRKLISSGIYLSSACIPTRDTSGIKTGGTGERVQHKELWGEEVTKTINDNVERIQKGGDLAKLEKLPEPKKEAKEAALRGYIKHGVSKAQKKMGALRTATSNIY